MYLIPEGTASTTKEHDRVRQGNFKDTSACNKQRHILPISPRRQIITFTKAFFRKH